MMSPQQTDQQKSEQMFLEQTLILLKESQANDQQSQRQVQKKLSEWSKLPEFNYSLMRVLCDPNSCDETTRSLSCLVLKNNVRKHYQSFPNELKDFIKRSSLDLLRDPSSVIRATVGILITNVAAAGELFTWTELLPTLGQLLNANELEIVESAFSALQRICEDLSEMLCTETLCSTLEAMLPRFLEFFSHPSAKIRNYALICANQFVPIKAEPIMNMIDKYVEALFLLANDQDTEVKKNVCRSLVALFETRPETLVPHLNVVIEYMIARSRDDDDEIALEACEFWLTVPENEYGKTVLRQYLPQLVPFFMEKMQHSPEDIEMMRADIEDNYMVPDKDDDIKPRFYKAKTQGNNGTDSKQETDQTDAQDISDLDLADLEDDDEDEDDDDGDDDVMGTSWNIRKCTAAALDTLAHSYADEILPFVFQELEKNLNNENWVVKEAAVLAIGAIAEGSVVGMVPHLPRLLPYLVERLSDKHPMVRSITCWTISRYTYWITEHPDDRIYGLVLESLLRCILDNNKRVQEAACSAFATMAEGAGMQLHRYLDQILTTLVQAFDKYQHKNLLNLYDAVGTLAEAVKSNLNQPKYIDMLMPPIIKKWNSLQDGDRDLFPLLECLSSIAVALCEGFKPHSEAVYRRCLSLVEQNLQQAIQFNIDPENTDMPNKDFTIAALDLLSGLAEGIKEGITDLVASSNIMDLTLQCMLDTLPEVRQSSFALLGDLTKACFHLVRPHIPQIMPPLSHNLRYEHVSVCNNATWAVGEIALQLRSDLRPYIPLIFGQLLANINFPDIPRTLLDNTAISIGRISFACPDDIAPMLKDFIKPWCQCVRIIRDNDAKDSAFRGICELIGKNPNGIVNDFFFFCDAVACWEEPKPDLKRLFYDILHGFKNQMSAEESEKIELAQDKCKRPKRIQRKRKPIYQTEDLIREVSPRPETIESKEGESVTNDGGGGSLNDPSITSLNGKKAVQCNICKRYMIESKLANHIRLLHVKNHSVNDENPNNKRKEYKCEYCGKLYAIIYTYQQHMKTHTEGRPKCPECGRTFATAFSLFRHRAKNHNLAHNYKVHNCDKCEKSFFSVSELKLHQQRHSSTKDFKCSECEKEFSVKGNLRIHMRTHAKEKLYKCDICENTFSHPYSLVSHRRIHTNDFPYKCPTCNKVYRSKHQLNSHINVHSDNRPFKCHECQKTFKSRTAFKMHQDEHKGIKRFTCKFCDRKFQCHGNKLKHERRHIGEKKHKCELCDKAFIEKQELKNHQKVHEKKSAQDVDSKLTSTELPQKLQHDTKLSEVIDQDEKE